MCLTTKTPEIQTANRDIVVYKQLTFRGWLKRPRAKMKDFAYCRGLQSKTVTLFSKYFCRDEYIVDEGYHSFESKTAACSNSPMNAVFVIPKGTQYIIGWYNDEPEKVNYVSENIVYIGRIGELSTEKRLDKFLSRND